jgi:hypothetical protein
MKAKIISNYGISSEIEINNWLRENPDIEIKYIKYASTVSSGGSIFHSVLIIYIDSIKI